MELKQNFTIGNVIVSKHCDNFLGFEVYLDKSEEDNWQLYFVKNGTVRGTLTASAGCGQCMAFISDLKFKGV